MKQNTNKKSKRKKDNKKQQRQIRQIIIPQNNQNVPYLQRVINQLNQNLKNKHSIKDIIKKGLEKKNREQFQYNKSKNSNKQIFQLVMQNLNQERNQKSNPSLFLKFLGNLKLSMLQENDIENLVQFTLNKLNRYISCDKNILYLLIKILKFCGDKVRRKLKQKIFEDVYNSLLLYFYEFRKFEWRKDNETLRNYIGHFKVFAELNKKKPSNYFTKDNSQIAIFIVLQSFFLGSILENQNFKNLDQFFIQLEPKIKRKENDFYFENQRNGLSTHYDSEMSSFSDQMNIIPQQQTNYEIIQDLYQHLTDILKLFVKKFLNNFYKGEIWMKIMGDSYISNSIKDYFLKVDFINCQFKEYIINQHTLESLYNQQTIDNYNQFKSNQNDFNYDDFVTHYKLYSQKLSQNDESLVLLLLVSKQNFIRQSILRVIQNLLKALPVDFFKQKDSFNQIDIMTVQMTRSFKSFQLILFQEILRCDINDDFLIPLNQFLVFLIEEDLYLYGNFSIFQKIVEYLLMKATKIQNFKKAPQKQFYSAIRLLRFFIPQTEANSNQLSPEQKINFNIFCQQALVIIIRKIFEANLEKNKDFDDIIMHAINIIGKLLVSKNFTPYNQVLNIRTIFMLVIKVIEQKNQIEQPLKIKKKNLDQIKGEKIKSKWFSSVMNCIAHYKNQIVEQENLFIYYKVMLAYIVGFSQNDSIFSLSMIDYHDIPKILFLQKRSYQKDEEFKEFCNLVNDILIKQHPGNVNILESYLDRSLKKKELLNLNQNLYAKLVKINLWYTQRNIKKVYILFLLNSFKNKSIGFDMKKEILVKIFKSKTRDSQDLFEGLLQIFIKGDYPIEFYNDQQIFCKLMYFLFIKIQEESVQKTVLKTMFVVLNQYAKQGFFKNQDHNKIFNELVIKIEKQKSKIKKIKLKRKKSVQQLKEIFSNNQHQFNRSHSQYRYELIPPQQTNKKKNKKQKFTYKEYLSLLKQNDITQDNFHFQLFFQYIFEKIKLIKEHKTHGFFFLQTMNFYKILMDLNLNYEQFINQKILHYYFNILGSNIIVDSYLTKSFFIAPSILNLLQDELKQKIIDFILNFDQIQQGQQKQEFNNNQVLCRKQIDKYIFELKLYALKYSLQNKIALDITREYFKNISQFLDNFEKFVKFNCGVIFVEMDENNKQIQKKILEINKENYIELNDLQIFLKENCFYDFDKFNFLKENFEVLRLIKNFLEDDDQIVIDMNKFEQISMLGNYEIEPTKITIPNVWEVNSNFDNTFN